MKEYKIKKTVYDKSGYSMIITDRVTGDHIAEYRLSPGCERAEIAQMRRDLDKHLGESGSTKLGNYQW